MSEGVSFDTRERVCFPGLISLIFSIKKEIAIGGIVSHSFFVSPQQ